MHLDVSTTRDPSHYPLHALTPPGSFQGLGHGNVWLAHTPLVPCQSALPFREHPVSKFGLENTRCKSWHVVNKTIKHPINLLPFNFTFIRPPITEKQLFQDLAENFKIKVKSEAKGRGHMVGSYHIDAPPFSFSRQSDQPFLWYVECYSAKTYIPNFEEK